MSTEDRIGEELPRAEGSSPIVPVPKRDRLTIKDWVTLTLSTFAFVISAGSAYFNIVRQTDDVRIMIPTAPFITVAEDHARLEVEPTETVLFINSGNRTAAISSVQLRAVQPTPEQRSCEDGRETFIEYETEPLVLKPGDIVARTMKLKGKRPPEYQIDPLKTAANDFITFPVSEDNQKRNTYWVRTCLVVEVVTPDNFKSISGIELYESEINKSGGYILPTFKSSEWINNPRTLVQRSGNIFFRN